MLDEFGDDLMCVEVGTVFLHDGFTLVRFDSSLEDSIHPYVLAGPILEYLRIGWGWSVVAFEEDTHALCGCHSKGIIKPTFEPSFIGEITVSTGVRLELEFLVCGWNGCVR